MSTDMSQVPTETSRVMPGFVVKYTPVRMAKRAADFRVQGRQRIISLIINVIINLVLYLIFRPDTKNWFFWLLVASTVYAVIAMIIPFVRMRGARKMTSKIPYGPALQVDTSGLVLATVPEGERVSWDEITCLKGKNRYFNPGPELIFKWGNNREWALPMVVMDALPGTIDSAIRAYSRGKYGLDLSAVDELW